MRRSYIVTVELCECAMNINYNYRCIIASHYSWLYNGSGKRAIMRHANLNGADLSGDDLRHADMSGADLRWANLSRANMSRANLRHADMSMANLSGANLRHADMSGADLRGAVGLPTAPVIPNIDSAILARIDAGGGLAMSRWHSCDTTHCRGGWAIHLAGKVGAALEDTLGTGVAAALIYAASRPTQRVPDFFARDKTALADMREYADGDQ